MWIFSAIANAIGNNFIGRPNYLFDLLFNRVQDDGGVTEAQQCTINELTDLQNDNLLSSASLVLTPSSYKEGKLYSVIPENGDGDFTFTRATTATRVNSDGLVELVPYNLFTYSEQFNNAVWTKVRTTITANSTSSPNNTLTADTITCSETSSNGCFFRQSITLSNERTTSIYVKANTGEYFQIHRDFGSGVVFNLSNGTVKQEVGATGTITSVGDGWYRCSATFSVSGISLFIVGNENMTVATWFSTINQSIYAWGAQLVEGTNALPYQKTETRLNIPRLDYSNGTCPSILLEPQRTNLALQSSSFDSATWTKFNTTIVANNAISPSGVQDADSMVENTATNLHLIYQSFTSVSSTTYTYSCYIKPNERTRAYLRTDISVGTKRTLFDLTGSGSVVSLAHDSATIKLLDNGYYYCTVTFTEGTGGSRLMAIEGAVGTSVNYTGNGLTAFYLWGAQLEAGSYATSYIPTTTASVTRNVDVLSKTGISSLIGQTNGTMFAEMKINSSSEFRVISISDNSVSNRVVFAVNGTTELRGFVVYGNTVGTVITTPIPSGTIKIAVRYTDTNYSFFVNGVLIGTQTKGAFTNPLITAANHQGNGGNSFYGFLNSFLLFQTPLTDDQLEALTGEGFDTYAAMASYYNYTLQ